MIVAFLVALLLFPSFISANENIKKETKTTPQTYQTYNLYKRTVIIFGKLHIKDTFTTPQDCKNLSISAKVGPYSTVDSTIYIGSDGWPLEVGGHTIWGTGWYILGNFIWPDLRVFYDHWFVPGLQYVEIGIDYFGSVTFWVNGSS